MILYLTKYELNCVNDNDVDVSFVFVCFVTSKCMHGMNQTEAEYSRHGKRSQRASLSQIGPGVLEV